MSKLLFDRRAALLGAGAFGLSAGLGAGSALARAPQLKTQAPGFYRFKIGAAQITMVSDGPLPLGAPTGNFLGASNEDIKKMLTENFLAPDTIVLDQNIPVVNTGKNLIVFDTGMGTSKMFGPTTGRLQKSLAEAGIRAAQVDSVVCTHAHIDHIGGLVDGRGRKLFP
ncbi:MAG: MBL fold metallo-hydrolase, partial [Proteobacteria bacterium]|nr:MBL fold metallo-hydrolase [Pseudomonadota bacterium]